MEKSVFEDYVANRYRNQMEYYDKSASKNQKKYRQFQWILIVLSALTPVLAALGGVAWSQDSKVISATVQILVVVVASIVAILTTGLKTFNYQELWANYRATHESLKPEIYYYEFSVGPYGVSGIDKESLFVSRIEAILNKEHTQWPPSKKLQDQSEKSADNQNETVENSSTQQ